MAENKDIEIEKEKAEAAQEEAAGDTVNTGEAEKTEQEAEAGNAQTEEQGSEKQEDQAAEENKASEEATAEKPDKKDQKIAELNDKYVRLFAEFDNFRKRSENEKAGMFTEGERTVLLKVLPLVDNFERALSTIPEDQKDGALAAGLEKVYRAFSDQLKELGVEQIEAVGQPFDANLHNAVMHVEDEEQPENIVVEEFQKGYKFHDKVLRYSMVKVAN